MTEKEMILFDSLIAEYELRAKYNNDQRDYEMYSMLVNAGGILAKGTEVYKEGRKNAYKELIDKCRKHRFVCQSTEFANVLEEWMHDIN